MQTIIDFMYTGKVFIDNVNVMDLLLAADYLLVDEVKQYCFKIQSKAQLFEKCSLKPDAYAYISGIIANLIANQL